MAILKLKNIKKTNYKSPILFKDVNIENLLESSKVFVDEKSYKYFVGYLYDCNKIKPMHIMLPKARTYVKRYDDQTNGMPFFDWR